MCNVCNDKVLLRTYYKYRATKCRQHSVEVETVEYIAESFEASVRNCNVNGMHSDLDVCRMYMSAGDRSG